MQTPAITKRLFDTPLEEAEEPLLVRARHALRLFRRLIVKASHPRVKPVLADDDLSLVLVLVVLGEGNGVEGACPRGEAQPISCCAWRGGWFELDAPSVFMTGASLENGP